MNGTDIWYVLLFVTESEHTMKGRWLLLVAFLLVCFNLRTGFDSPDPLLGTIEKDMGLSLDGSGLFALLPVFVLGVAAPLSPLVSHWMTPWKIIFWFQLLAVIGILWRSCDGIVGLYGGMILMGLGMGIAGAAIPGLIKQQFPDRASSMMGVYSAMVGVGSATASGLSVPFSNILGGWRYGLGIWTVSILLGMLIWLAYFFKRPAENIQSKHTIKGHNLLCSSKAWQVTIFYLSRVGAAYFFYTWIPIFLRQRGMSYDEAGFILAVALFAQLPATLTAHTLEKITGGKGLLIVISMALAALSCWGILYLSTSWIFWLSIMFGLATGTVFSRGMALMVERAQSPSESIRLSGMAQGIGFSMGALLSLIFTPFLQQSGSFLPFCLVYTFFCVIGMISGRMSACPGYV